MSGAPDDQRPTYTAADFARDVARVSVRAAVEMNSLTQGMWNPRYCSRDAAVEARNFCADLRSHLEHIEGRLAALSPAPAVQEGKA